MKILRNKIESYLEVDPFILDQNVKKKNLLI